MKKNIFKGFIALMLCFISVLFISSCGKTDELVEKVTLETPTELKYDYDTSKVSWKAVSNADYYEVSFDGGEASKVSTSSVKYTPKDVDEFTFTIKAKSNGVYLESQAASKTFAFIDGDIELALSENGEVTWEEVPGATSYIVNVDNKDVGTVLTNSYSELTPGAAHTIKVRPNKEDTASVGYYSKWSDKKTLTILGEVAKNSIKYENGSIKWDKVNSADGYEVIVNGETYDATTNSLIYEASNQNFNVTVKAKGNGTTTFNGKESAQKQFVYLDTVSNVTVEDGVLTWSAIENATGYQVKLRSNSNQPVNVNENKYEGLAAGTQYNVSVLPVGNDAEISYFANWSISTPILILGAPDLKWTEGVDVDGTDVTNAIHWDQVSGATGYVYELKLPNEEVESGTLGINDNFYGNTFATVGTYEVKVKALADGADGIFDSAYSTPFTVKRLAAPSISAENVTSNPNNLKEGFNVTFAGIAEATAYELYKEGTKIQTQKTTQFRVTDLFEEGKTREDSYAYYVRSVGTTAASGKKMVLSSLLGDKSDSSAFTITILQTPNNPTVTGKDYDAEYSFTGVANAGNGYCINVAGSPFDSSTTTYNLATLEEGTYEIKSCAKGNGNIVLASDFTTSIYVTRINAPYDLKINCDESDGTLEFSGAQKANSYQLFITGGEQAIPVDTTTNVRNYITTQATIIFMRAIANYFEDTQETKFIMTSKPSTNYTFAKLEAPTNINFSNTNMTWNAPSNLNANGAAFTPNYKIIDNATSAVYNGEFAGRSYPLDDLDAGTYSFGIIAKGDGVRFINSEKADSKEIRKLEIPNFSVDVANSNYQWNSIIGAASYALKIDGKVVDTSDENYSGNVYSYHPTYNAIGKHTVEIFAVGDGGETTINSKTFTYEQNVAQLATPTFKYSYNYDYYDKTNGLITMAITQPSDNATGYVYNIGAADHKEIGADKTSFDFNPNTSGEMPMYVYAVGGGFDDAEVYYLDSQSAATQTLIILGYPTESTIEISKQGLLKWGQIKNAPGYIVTLKLTDTSDEEYTATITINTNTASLELTSVNCKKTADDSDATLTWAQIKTLEVEIQAKGNLVKDTLVNGTKYVTSEKVTHKFTQSLH